MLNFILYKFKINKQIAIDQEFFLDGKYDPLFNGRDVFLRVW
jgi:hypothetical protein